MTQACWICDHTSLTMVKEGDIKKLSSDNFAITNADYGITQTIYQCGHCGFLQCSDQDEVVSYYEDLVDPQYETTREARKLQEEKVLDIIGRYKKSGSILDIGAGSGILVEAALQRGYEAVGIEPSKWLTAKATERGLPVHLGIFPHPAVTAKYDVITLVDVIEHVDDPKALVKEISAYLAPGGIFIMVTPDVGSFFAKLLKYKWWHFRVAHIGYFDKKTLDLLTTSAGLKTAKIIRPSWYLSLSYLIERVYSYLPKILHLPLPRFFNTIIIPLNLRDSWLGIYNKSS